MPWSVRSSPYQAGWGNLFDGYRALLQANVLDPIGMRNTTVSFEQVRERDDYAIPHSLGLDGMYAPLPVEFEEVLIPAAPAGAHWSTLEDMTRYMLTELALWQEGDALIVEVGEFSMPLLPCLPTRVRYAHTRVISRNASISPSSSH